MNNTYYGRLIHIKADSNVLSVNIIIPENRAEETLIDIRDGWSEFVDAREIKDKLVVKTCVHNPTLF